MVRLGWVRLGYFTLRLTSHTLPGVGLSPMTSYVVCCDSFARFSLSQKNMQRFWRIVFVMAAGRVVSDFLCISRPRLFVLSVIFSVILGRYRCYYLWLGVKNYSGKVEVRVENYLEWKCVKEVINVTIAELFDFYGWIHPLHVKTRKSATSTM